jgi:hypothetical protein
MKKIFCFLPRVARIDLHLGRAYRTLMQKDGTTSGRSVCSAAVGDKGEIIYMYIDWTKLSKIVAFKATTGNVINMVAVYDLGL